MAKKSGFGIIVKCVIFFIIFCVLMRVFAILAGIAAIFYTLSIMGKIK